MSTHSMLSHDIIYRVQVIEGTNSIHVTCIGIECVDSAVREGYYTLSDLPEWFSGRLAVLSICSTDPPIPVEGVGRRIDENTYWVYAE
jgi:hypothetical protein